MPWASCAEDNFSSWVIEAVLEACRGVGGTQGNYKGALVSWILSKHIGNMSSVWRSNSVNETESSYLQQRLPSRLPTGQQHVAHHWGQAARPCESLHQTRTWTTDQFTWHLFFLASWRQLLLHMSATLHRCSFSRCPQWLSWKTFWTLDFWQSGGFRIVIAVPISEVVGMAVDRVGCWGKSDGQMEDGSSDLEKDQKWSWIIFLPILYSGQVLFGRQLGWGEGDRGALAGQYPQILILLLMQPRWEGGDKGTV